MSHEIRSHMVDICRRMNSSGINQGTSGNLSVRIEEGFLITPTSLRYELMTAADIVEMDFDGQYSGDRLPSSEWRFHRDILTARPDRDVVLHCHSSFATSVAIHGRDIPAIHYMVAIAGGNVIKCAGYVAYGTQELSDLAVAALGPRDACLLGHHGQIAIGTDMERALRIAIEVETLARFYIQSSMLCEPPVLSDQQMKQVIEQMGRMRYGQPPDSETVTTRAVRRTA